MEVRREGEENGARREKGLGDGCSREGKLR